jgi:chemotaxis protein histidine kinase CheA
MAMTFDLDDDERPIFLAESDEQLQSLDEGFVRLEREAHNPELLQTIFRAAHTLKGSAGAIGHRRMAEVTHGLETVLDGLRKGTLSVQPDLVDVCLESLDSLRVLLGEVIQGAESDIDVKPLVSRLASLAVVPNPAVAATALTAIRPAPGAERPAQPAPVKPANRNGRMSNGHKSNGHLSSGQAANGHKAKAANGRGSKTSAKAKAKAKPAKTGTAAKKRAAPKGKTRRAASPAPRRLAAAAAAFELTAVDVSAAPSGAMAAPTVRVSAAIDAHSIASAARALQLMLAL